jgi:hypothetical protein
MGSLAVSRDLAFCSSGTDRPSITSWKTALVARALGNESSRCSRKLNSIRP